MEAPHPSTVGGRRDSFKPADLQLGALDLLGQGLVVDASAVRNAVKLGQHLRHDHFHLLDTVRSSLVVEEVDRGSNGGVAAGCSSSSRMTLDVFEAD